MVGISTHFATTPTNIDYAKYQLELFNGTVDALKQAGYTFKYIHAANSGAIARLPHQISILFDPV